MKKETKQESPKSKKNFFARLMENLDKKLEEKSKSSGCCCGNKDDKSSCS